MGGPDDPPIASWSLARLTSAGRVASRAADSVATAPCAHASYPPVPACTWLAGRVDSEAVILLPPMVTTAHRAERRAIDPSDLAVVVPFARELLDPAVGALRAGADG